MANGLHLEWKILQSQRDGGWMKIPYTHIPSVGGSAQPIPSVNRSTVPLKHVNFSRNNYAA